jgi:hypothetical protein
MSGWTEADVKVILDMSADPWHWALADFIWDYQGYLCNWLGYVPLPGFITGIKGHWDEHNPEYFAPLGDWFGDDLGSLWHIYVCDPVRQRIWPHLDTRLLWLEMPLAEARKRLYPEELAWIDESIEEHKRWDAERAERDRERA